MSNADSIVAGGRCDTAPDMPAELNRRTALAVGAAAALSGATASGAAAQTTPSQVGRRFAGRLVLITGAARGIGRATALAFAREGADIVAVDVADPNAVKSIGYPLASEADLRETVRLVEALGRRCAAHQVDTRDGQALRQIAEQAGPIDVCVANAGVLPRVSMEETTATVWRECLDVNLAGTWHAILAVTPGMRERRRGRIITVASEFARHAVAPNRAVYTASKWAVLGLTKAVAMELVGSGITVNAVCPGFTRTGMALNDEVFRALAPQNPTLPAVEARLVELNSGRNAQPIAFVEPEEIAAAILYLASDEARTVTGAGMDVNGGFSPGLSA